MVPLLSRIEHLVVLLAETVTLDDALALPGLETLADDATACPAYHLAPHDEDVDAAWTGFATRVGDALVMEHVDADGLVEAVTAWRDPELAEHALLAVALAGTLPDRPDVVRVTDPDLLGEPGVLLLVSPLTPPGWVCEEVLDHTSLLQLGEHWTTARGAPVTAEVPDARREICGDLLGALELREPDSFVVPAPSEGRRAARPVPYFPVVDVNVGADGVRLSLANVGPAASRSVPLAVDDGEQVSHHVVAPSALDDRRAAEVPVTVRDGAYDVTVTGPDHLHRRFAGTVANAGVTCTVEHFADGDPWFPGLELTVSHRRAVPVFFWLDRHDGPQHLYARAGGGRFERLPGPRRSAVFREEPTATTHGWYDVVVTTSDDPAWVREYAGHLGAGGQPGVGY